MRTAARVALLALPLLAACTSRVVETRDDSLSLVWPSDGPRVRFERMLTNRRDAGAGRGILDWLVGRSGEPIFERPYALAWDEKALVVADPGAHRVVRIAERGRVVQSPAGQLHEPVGVTVCFGAIVVSDSWAGTVSVFGQDLRRSRVIAEGLARPTGLACLGDRLFIAETGAHRVLAVTADGRRQVMGRRGEGPGEFNFPTTIAAAGDTLYVGDAMNFRVQRLRAADGESQATFGRLGDASGEMPRTKGIAVDSAGHIWVSDGYLDQVGLFDRDGSLLISIGRGGGAAGEFSFPAGVAAREDGIVAVADSLNRRIQFFSLIAAEGPSSARP